jgi:ferrous iron transport protein A
MTQAVPLNQPAKGLQGTITRIDGDDELKRKLMSQGLRKGQLVSILQQRSNGVVVMSNGSRVALGASIAQHVFLQMLQTSDIEQD